jgi:hypothetical protein
MARDVTFGLTYSVKDAFFDRAAVLSAIGKAEAKELSRIGAFIRQTARNKVLRMRNRTSRPGEAPSVHSRDRVRSLRNILFAYEKTKHAVIIGPVRLNQLNVRFDGSSDPVPKILEFGGPVVIHEERKVGSEKWYRRDLRVTQTGDTEYRTRVANYEARPFMKTALEIEINAGTIRNVWRSSLVGKSAA